MADRSHVAALVVEDDVLLRLDLVETLQRAGYRTYEASEAKDAIVLLEANPDIRVVFTDIEMPGSMDGLALAHYVRFRWPPTFIVVSSGQLRPTPSLLPTETEFLPKPFAKDELVRICRSLDARLAGSS